MSDLSGMAWVWLPPEGTPTFLHSLEACRTRFEQRQRFFQGLLGLRPAGADTLAPPLCKHLGSSAKFFHVAGTNGKGSACAVLEGCLRALPDKKIGCFMSPHIHTYRERIRVNGELLPADRVGPLVEQAKAVAGDHARDFTFFDKLLLLAFLYFEEMKVDYIVFETGLGGRWDPTNVIEGTERLPVSIITSISKDHQEVLGDTLAKIAWQKAGIMKPGIPVVTMASQHPDVLQVFEEEARLRHTQLHVIDTANEEATELVRPRLEGDTQRENVTLAMAALRLWLEREEAPEEVDAKMRLLMSGLSLVFHPCRFEIFHVPAGGDAKRTIPLVIDGGHNEDGLHKLFDYAKKRFSGSRLVVVLGCSLYEKKLRECMAIVSQHAHQIAFVVSTHFKAAPVAAMRQQLYEVLPGPQPDVKGDVSVAHPKELAVEATEVGKPSVGDGIKAALALAASENTGEAPCVVMVCGSLFSAADARCFLATLIPFPAHDWVHHADPVTNAIKPYK